MNMIATTLALAAGISCAAFGYEPPRHNDTFMTNGITYAQRGGLGASDYVVTNIDANAVGKVKSVNGKTGDVSLSASDVSAIPTTGGVFNAYIHLNQKFSVGTWTQSVKPIESVGGSGIAFAFGDNVQTRSSNSMVLGVGALNTNNWSFVWNGDANRMYFPTIPNRSNPYSSRYNGGFHVNPSVRDGMTNPLQNFWIGDTNLATWVSTLAPAPSNYAAVSNAAMNAASRVDPTITNMIRLVGYGNSRWELFGGQTGWYFTDTNGNAYRIEFNSDSFATSNDVGSASDVLLASRKWVYDRYLPKSGGTVTGALTVQENLTVGEGSATGLYSVSEGYGMAYGDYSHAEGHNTTTTVFGIDAHAEGSSTTANGYASHAEGGFTTADNEYSHAEGESTTAQNVAEHAQGRFNASHKSSVTFGDAGNTLSSIGFGTADSNRKNALETMQDGKTFVYGLGGYDGTNPTNGVKDLVAAIEGKADAADIPEWAKAPTKPTYTASEVGATSPTAVSNIVTTAYVREKLGVYLYVGEDGGIYVHTNED